MSKVYNFSAGPAALPKPVLLRAQSELLDYHGHGVSIMEVSHRGPLIDEIVEQSEQRLRRLMQVPDDYAVLFLQGGASAQFAQLVMNLTTEQSKGSYLVSGAWGRKACQEALRMERGSLLASSEDSGFSHIPEWRVEDIEDTTAYLHITSNETIGGVQFHDWPEVPVPLAVDMCSDILSRPLDVSRFGVIYAGAQKNIGPSGLALVVIRRDLLERSAPNLPNIFSYKVQAEYGSRYNTPATFAWYLADLVLQWIEEEGGVSVMEQRNQRKSRLLYDFVDGSDFYTNRVPEACRSIMNVPFHLQNDDLTQQFVEQALQQGLSGLKGHKLAGGIRASLYNAMPEAGVLALLDFMKEFMRVNG